MGRFIFTNIIQSKYHSGTILQRLAHPVEWSDLDRANYDSWSYLGLGAHRLCSDRNRRSSAFRIKKAPARPRKMNCCSGRPYLSNSSLRNSHRILLLRVPWYSWFGIPCRILVCSRIWALENRVVPACSCSRWKIGCYHFGRRSRRSVCQRFLISFRFGLSAWRFFRRCPKTLIQFAAFWNSSLALHRVCHCFV